MFLSAICLLPCLVDVERFQPLDGPMFFESLSEAHARSLHGEWVTVRLRIDSLPGEHNGYTIYDCVNRDDHSRTVWFRDDQAIDESKPVTVHGQLFVIEHKPGVIGDTKFEGFTEIRVMQATASR